MGRVILKWDAGYSVGIKSFDDQHRQLFDIINKLYTLIVDRKVSGGKERLAAVLAEILDYTKKHFEAEEREMKAAGYPDYEKHKKEHDDFLLKVTDFNSRLQKGNVVMTVEVLSSLVKWLDTHLNGTDKLYTPFLTGKGVQ